MFKTLPKKTKHNFSFRPKTSKTRLLKQCKSVISPICGGEGESESCGFYAFRNTPLKHKITLLPGLHPFLCKNLNGLSYQGQNHALFGRKAIAFKNYGQITAKCLEACHVFVCKLAKKKRIWCRLCCQIPMTARAAETRMGKGKGAISYWVTKVYPGLIWLEFEGLNTKTFAKILAGLQHRCPYSLKAINV
jgi:large subunit ribosomal protein L16